MKAPSRQYSIGNSHNLVGHIARVFDYVRPTPRLIWMAVASSISYVAAYEVTTPYLSRIRRKAARLTWDLRGVAKANPGLGASFAMDVLTGELIQLINDDDREVLNERVVVLSGKPAISEAAASNCRLLEMVMLTLSRLVDDLGQAAALDGVIGEGNDDDYVHLHTLVNNAWLICKRLRALFPEGAHVVYRFHNPAFAAAEWPVV